MTSDLLPSLHMSLLECTGDKSPFTEISMISGPSMASEQCRISHSSLGHQGEGGRYFVLEGAERTIIGIWGYELELVVSKGIVRK